MHRVCQERFPRHRLQRKPLVSDPGMHHGTCLTHVPWCLSGSLTRGGGKTFPTFPAHAQPAILPICQEAHGSNAVVECSTICDEWEVRKIYTKRKIDWMIDWRIAGDTSPYSDRPGSWGYSAYWTPVYHINMVGENDKATEYPGETALNQCVYNTTCIDLHIYWVHSNRTGTLTVTMAGPAPQLAAVNRRDGMCFTCIHGKLWWIFQNRSTKPLKFTETDAGRILLVCWRKINTPRYSKANLWPPLLTWINFNPSMDT